jgi:hypothetical protein
MDLTFSRRLRLNAAKATRSMRYFYAYGSRQRFDIELACGGVTAIFLKLRIGSLLADEN